MENNKKNRTKINAFDIFLILLVLCLIATLVFRIFNGISSDKNSYDNEYILSFTCEGEYDSILDYVKSGDAVYLPSGELLGYITFSDENKTGFPLEIINDNEYSNNSADFNFVKFSGVLKMNGNAQKIDKGNYYLIGDDKITEGATITVHTMSVEFTVSVTNIEKINTY